jgi:hypothetical protein
MWLYTRTSRGNDFCGRSFRVWITKNTAVPVIHQLIRKDVSLRSPTNTISFVIANWLKFAERIFEWNPDKFISSPFATSKIHNITKVTEGGLYRFVTNHSRHLAIGTDSCLTLQSPSLSTVRASYQEA